MKNYYLIGIGGVSMSAIAMWLKKEGNNVSGSDANRSIYTDMLINEGINVTIGTCKENISKNDIIIYTASIKEDNEELQEARKLNKTIYDRSEFMGLICEKYKNVLCIAGTHGKSTCTGMTSLVYLENKVNPTIMVGAILPEINSNFNYGNHDYLILETCEFKDSFLHFKPTDGVILNIDNDHLDYFKNLDNIKKSFNKFSHLISNYLIINNDDINTSQINFKNKLVLTYGIENKADVKATNISYDEYGHPIFDVYYQNDFYNHLHLNVSGTHNIYNALATVSLSIIHNLDKDLTKIGLEKFHGVGRRFEKLGKLDNNVLVYDDYAHHPTEIKSTLESAKNIKCHQNFAVFQSHTYSRTKDHLEEFAEILKNFDNVIIAPIYAAREENIYNIKEDDLVNLIKKDNPNVIYLDSYEKIVDYLKENLVENDLIITIGAGPINKVGQMLLNKKAE